MTHRDINTLQSKAIVIKRRPSSLKEGHHDTERYQYFSEQGNHNEKGRPS
jgi:hypothetical protein